MHLREQGAPGLPAIPRPAWLPRAKFSFGLNWVYLLLNKKINNDMQEKIARNSKARENGNKTTKETLNR
jgi:hypothetical protein